jgi:hypothetical protein
MDQHTLIARLRDIRTPAARRELIESFFAADGWTLSDVLTIEHPVIQTEMLEVLNGYVREGGRPRQYDGLRIDARIKLRTVDGEPLGRVRMGLDPRKRWNVRQQRSKAMRGETIDLYREFPAEFEADIPTATHLLRHFGWGIHTPRYFARNAELRNEIDAHGGKVKRRDTWRLVESGSLQEELARNERGEPVAKPRRRSSGG